MQQCRRSSCWQVSWLADLLILRWLMCSACVSLAPAAPLCSPRPCVAFPPEACVLVPLRCRCVSHPPPRSEALPRPSAFAPTLLAVATEAGCPNLAVALALLLGDQPALQRFAGRHPEVWADLHGLLANDVHLCGYAPMLSPLPSPVVRTGSLPVGALLAA